MPDFQSMKRNATLRIKLTDRIHDEITEYAELFGVPASTLAAFVLGDWLNRQNMQKKAISDLVVNLASDDVISKMEKALGPTIAAVVAEGMNSERINDDNVIDDRNIDECSRNTGKKGRKDRGS